MRTQTVQEDGQSWKVRTPDDHEPLDGEEYGRLLQLEGWIKAGVEKVGKAFREIRDKRLYREKASTFEEYCSKFWKTSYRHINRQIQAASVIETLGPNGPTKEAQARELVSLPSEAQQAVWEKAVQTAPAGKVTAAHVKAVVNTRHSQPVHIFDVQMYRQALHDVNECRKLYQSLPGLVRILDRAIRAIEKDIERIA